MDRTEKTAIVKKRFLEAGFSDVGIASAAAFHTEAEKLKEWLGLGYHGKMDYMENHFEKRTQPEKLVPGTRSIVCLVYNYATEKSQMADAPKIAKYAYGKDYHKVIKKKIKSVVAGLEDELGPFKSRAFVDSAPVLERDLARRAGMGWLGKNTLLIHPRRGSFFFLAELFVDFELEPDEPIADYCGRCTRCIDACPTDAISEEGYLMDASRCISYLTIELKDEELPEEFRGKMDNWAFGCDVCQDVCPWNRFSQAHREERFEPSEELLNMSKEEWQALDEETFNELFSGSAVRRTGFKGLKRNISFLD